MHTVIHRADIVKVDVQWVRNCSFYHRVINGSITNEKTRELCGFTKQQARSTLDKMREEKLIQLVGAGLSSKYIKLSETR